MGCPLQRPPQTAAVAPAPELPAGGRAGWSDGVGGGLARVRVAAQGAEAGAGRIHQDAVEAEGALGAEGIGLCRTEHMFREGERLEIVRGAILVSGAAMRARAKAESGE